MDAAYLKAAHPEPFTVLGKKLKPFCIGHEILLQRFGNRFSIENNNSKNPPCVEDLLTGVFVCAQPYRKDASLDEFSIPFRARILSKFFGLNYLGRAFVLFSSYIASHSDIPDFYSKSDEATETETGTPTIQAVKVSLMANLGLSEDDALNMPLSLAFWNHLSWAESQGGIQIIDEAERKRQEQKATEAKAMEAWVEKLAQELFPNGYTPNVGRMNGS